MRYIGYASPILLVVCIGFIIRLEYRQRVMAAVLAGVTQAVAATTENSRFRLATTVGMSTTPRITPKVDLESTSIEQAVTPQENLIEIEHVLAAINTAVTPLTLIMFALLIVVIVMAAVILHHVKRIDKSHGIGGPFFGLEFSTNQNSLIIKLSVLNLSPSTYNFKGGLGLQAIKVVGKWRPKLTLSWPGLMLSNNRTGSVIAIQHSIKLSWKEAKQLREILRQEYFILPVVFGECKIIYVEWNGTIKKTKLTEQKSLEQQRWMLEDEEDTTLNIKQEGFGVKRATAPRWARSNSMASLPRYPPVYPSLDMGKAWDDTKV